MSQNIFDLVDTWNDGGTVFSAIKMNVTNTASAAGSLVLDLQVDGSPLLSVSPTVVDFSGINVQIDNNQAYQAKDTGGTVVGLITMSDGNIIRPGNPSHAMEIFSNGTVDFVGPVAANNTVEIQAATTKLSILRMQGTDISHPVTALQPSDIYLGISAVSGTNGGTNIESVVDSNLNAIQMRGTIGITNPTVAVMRFLAAKSDGGSTIAALSASEISYQFANFNGGTDFFQIGGEGNSAFGAPHNTTLTLLVRGTGSDRPLQVENSGPTAMLYSGMASQSASAGESAADSMLFFRKDTTTSRSISAAGTINASGADYAEYEEVAAGVGRIAKGDIVGFNSDGKLVDKFSLAVSFGIKSTTPNMVGGDTWGSEAVIGVRPVKPQLVKPDFTTVKPDGLPIPQAPDAPVKPRPDALPADTKAYDAQMVIYTAAKAAYDADKAAYDLALPIHTQAMADYKAATAAHDAAIAALQTTLDTVDIPAYDTALTAWKANFETARQKIDRVAYCGKTPVNGITAGGVGDFIVPVAGTGDVIQGKVVSKTNMTLSDMLDKVGRIHSIGKNGKPLVTVSMG